MQLNSKNSLDIIGKITFATLCIIVAIGLTFVFFEVKPFWVDEWFIIDSLKEKSTTALWGELNFNQQFPRVYLVIFKTITHWFNYSYFSLRLIPFVVSICTIAISYNVMKKIFKPLNYSRYLFVLILVSSFTFLEYYVEVKQYSMDIFLSVVALWQFIELLNMPPSGTILTKKYILLCASFLIAPFFSYTYPIAIAPVYIIITLQTTVATTRAVKFKEPALILKWIPLFIGIINILAFYKIDVQHLVNDKIMYDRWSFLLMDKGNQTLSAVTNIYTLFSQTGAGLLFETLFGILGIVSYIAGIKSTKNFFKSEPIEQGVYIKMYCSLLLTLTILLFIAGKLPLGTPRLNAFTTASIGILIIYFIEKLSALPKRVLFKKLLPVIFYIGVIGNIFVWYVNYFSSTVYKKQLAIYRSTQKAILLATKNRIPILITPGITYPYEQATVDAGTPDPQIWVLKTFPAYKVSSNLQVYAITDTGNAPEFLKNNTGIATVIVGNGENYHVVIK